MGLNKDKLRRLIEMQVRPLESKMLAMKANDNPIQREVVLGKLEVLYILLQELDSLPERENPADIRTNY